MVWDRHVRTVFARPVAAAAAGGLVVIIIVVVVVIAVGRQRDPDRSTRAADHRERQARQAAADAGLPRDVQSLLGLAARAPVATFSATYSSGTDRVVVHQRPPRRRVDVVVGGTAREALVTDGMGGGDDLRCTRASGRPWICETAEAAGDGQGDGSGDGLGAFSPELVARAVEVLEDGAGAFDLEVRTTTIAGTRARCLRSTPTTGVGTAAELCVSPQGVPLYLDRGDGSPVLRAIAYLPSAAERDVRRPDR